MAQAKGVLPTKADDREILYRNPRTCGYFVGVRLVGNLTAEQLTDWLRSVDASVDVLVAREEPQSNSSKGDKVAAVAAGFSAAFFERLTATGSALETPVGFRPDLAPPNGWLGGVPALNVEVMFYVAAVYETRVNEFLSTIGASPAVESVHLERGYQTSDETEPFGYKDGERNVRRSERSRVVFVHTDGNEPDEPRWADGGTYMVTMTIIQNPEAFASLPDDAARDAVIGRTKDGRRLDLQGSDVHPHDEPIDVAEGLPPNSHVRKAGPRGAHDDTEIFRRGMPFMDVVDGKLQVGLQFCSFQANPAQFDTVFNDWMMNHHFPPRADGTIAGPDALLAGTGPAGAFTQMVHAGLFFVPPYHEDGLVASLSARTTRGRPTHGRLVVSKIVVDPTDHTKRLERGGFVFRVHAEDGSALPGAEFTTTSTGRGVCPVELDLDTSYRLVEISSPHQADPRAETPFTMRKPNEHLRVVNQLTQSGGYGSR